MVKMKVKVLQEKKDKILVEVEGQDAAFCNAIKKELWQDRHIKMAAFNMEHPLVSNPKIVVETDGKESPRAALEKAAERLKKQSKEMKSGFVKEVK